MHISNFYKEVMPKSFWFHKEITDWRFNIIFDKSEIFIQELFSKNLFASCHYGNVEFLFRNDNSLENSSLVEMHIVNLFNDFHMTSIGVFEIANIYKILHEKGKLNPLNNNNFPR